MAWHDTVRGLAVRAARRLVLDILRVWLRDRAVPPWPGPGNLLYVPIAATSVVGPGTYPYNLNRQRGP